VEFQSGEILLGRREERGLTRDDVYRKLRIPADFIQHLEQGELDRLPAMTYTSGFVKTYCEFLDVNPGPVLIEIESILFKRKSLFKGALSDDPEDRPAWVNELAMWAGILAFLLIGWIAYTVLVQPATQPEQTQVQADILDTRVEKTTPRTP
jgi:cytoskeleton protein RodZ